MAETAYFRGEGGHVWEMNLPLSEAHARREQEGALVRVNQDGSPYQETSEPAVPQRPAKSASKKDWVAYAVSQGADEAEAESATRDELAEAYGDTEPQ
ncbi:hypothetical protein NC239_26615 [Streptomyces sp. G3]|uniref:hypothetical protein n=1 Tax=Streptomyces sp. G3 TaxID=690144 RepID=UPI00202DD6F4|nr:hypothetical protein [Streptomyces sp. G3]MCM1941776.1 hypothetical protein [Streptomyces sp. G3]